MSLIEFITERGRFQRILEHLGEPTPPPPTAWPVVHPTKTSIEFASIDPLPLYEFD